VRLFQKLNRGIEGRARFSANTRKQAEFHSRPTQFHCVLPQKASLHQIQDGRFRKGIPLFIFALGILFNGIGVLTAKRGFYRASNSRKSTGFSE